MLSSVLNSGIYNNIDNIRCNAYGEVGYFNISRIFKRTWVFLGILFKTVLLMHIYIVSIFIIYI